MARLHRLIGRLVGAPLRYTPLRLAGFVVAVGLLVVFALLTTDGVAATGGAIAALVAAAAIVLVLGTGASQTAPGPTSEGTGPPPAIVVGPSDGRPLVAVVVTTHNEGRLVEQCLRSVRDQTGVAFECIVMDDDSRDDTPAIARAAIGGDPRFRIVRSNSVTGASRQRNAGVVATSAPLVTFLDGDDFLYPGSLAGRAAAVTDHPALGGVYCDWVEVAAQADRTGPRRGGRVSRVTWLRGTEVEGVPFIATAPMLRREAFVAVGGFRPIGVAEDVDLWQRMLRRGFYFDSVSEVGVAYRQRAQSAVHTDAVESALVIAGILRSNLQPLQADARGPFVFREPYYEYPPRMMLVRRMVRAMAFAVADGAGVEEHLRTIDDFFEPHMEWTLNLSRLISSSARLAAMAADETNGVRRAVEDRLTDLLAPFADAAIAEAGRWRSDPAEVPLEVGEVGRQESS